MTIRFRAASTAATALVLGVSLAAAGCGKYSIGTLKAIKSFKDGNLYVNVHSAENKPGEIRGQLKP